MARGRLVSGPDPHSANGGGLGELDPDQIFAQRKREAFKPRVIPSGELFDGSQEIQIEHGRMIYRLLITKSGKLVLNK